MTIAHTQNNQELEESGEDELTVATVRYTGPQSVYNATAMRNQGYFPSMAVLQGGPDGTPGPWVIALIPSKRLGFYERHADLEIAYDRETVAAACLEKNTLPSPVFGRNYDEDVRGRVLDHLEINSLPRQTDAIRERLAEIAGVDQEPGADAGADSFPYDLTRSELWSVSKPLDPPYDWNGMQTTEAEDFLLEQETETVRTLVNQLRAGTEPGLEDVDGEERAESADDSEQADSGGE